MVQSNSETGKFGTLKQWTIKLWTSTLWTLKLWAPKLWTPKLWTPKLWTPKLRTLELVRLSWFCLLDPTPFACSWIVGCSGPGTEKANVEKQIELQRQFFHAHDLLEGSIAVHGFGSTLVEFVHVVSDCGVHRKMHRDGEGQSVS